MGNADELGLRRERRVGPNSDVARTRSGGLRWVVCGGSATPRESPIARIPLLLRWLSWTRSHMPR